MRKIIGQIPNSLTLLNLLCGSIAVLAALRGYLAGAAILMAIGYLADLFDGLAARLLKAQSPIGKELDSLADLITFGLAPAAVLFGLQEELGQGGAFTTDLPTGQILLRLLPFILPVFAGLRLARFNTDARQTHQFIGLPTPANGLMVMALPLALQYQPDSFLVDWLRHDLFIPLYSVVVSVLMVSPFRLYSLKIKGLQFNTSKYAYLLALIALILIALFRFNGLFLAIPVYVVYAGGLSYILRE